MGVLGCDVWGSFFAICHQASSKYVYDVLCFSPWWGEVLWNLDSRKASKSVASIHLPFDIQPQQFLGGCHIFIKTIVSHPQIRNHWVDINLERCFLSPIRHFILQQDICLIPLTFIKYVDLNGLRKMEDVTLVFILSEFVPFRVLHLPPSLPSLDK